MTVSAERGERQFASGDRIMFLRNERELGVKNGTLGTVVEVTPQRMSVRVDDGRSLAFNLKDYAHIDHGYAATIHKAQGMTVDRAHVLATPGVDSHGAYVALSRHRDGVALHYGQDDFTDQGQLIRTLSRDRGKDMASDYASADAAQAFAERRGITFRERVAEIIRKAPEKVRSIFEGLRLPIAKADVPEPAVLQRKMVEDPEAELRRVRTRALIRHARAVEDIFATQDAGPYHRMARLLADELGQRAHGLRQRRHHARQLLLALVLQVEERAELARHRHDLLGVGGDRQGGLRFHAIVADAAHLLGVVAPDEQRAERGEEPCHRTEG